MESQVYGTTILTYGTTIVTCGTTSLNLWNHNPYGTTSLTDILCVVGLHVLPVSDHSTTHDQYMISCLKHRRKKRYRKMMLIKKPKLTVPKNKKFVIRRQIWKIIDREGGGLLGGAVQTEVYSPDPMAPTCHLLKTSCGLKESWRGVTRPSCCKITQHPNTTITHP